MRNEYNDENFYAYQNKQLIGTYNMEQQLKKKAEYLKKKGLIDFLCQGVPLILAIIFYITTNNLDFETKIGVILVYAGIPAFILSFIHTSAINSLANKYNIY